MKDDTIKRSDAIKALHEEWDGAWMEVTGEWVADNCEAILDRLPSADRWIPCSERMPEETEWIGTERFGTTISDKVLVTFESKGERFVKSIHFQNGELGGMDKHTMDTFYGEWKAVAWMPLPEPWEGVDE